MKEACFFLIRHGESKRNATPDLMGQSPDEELTYWGKEQAKKLGHFLLRGCPETFDRVYASPYKRAWETAQIACANFQDEFFDITPVDALREYSAGDMLDKSRKEVLSEETLEKMNNLGMNFKFPNGESLYDVEGRVSTWMNGILKFETKSVQNILVFSHGMAIKCLLHYIMQFDQKMTWRVKIDNTSITKVRFKDGVWYIESINSIPHLL
jgi:probable phosphoglycerate mutase